MLDSTKTPRRTPAPGAPNERGAVAVELALVLPILLALLLGIVWIGIAFNAHVTLTQAAREGVRALALGTGDGVTQTQAAAVGLDQSQLSVTPTACPTPAAPDDNAQIHATYPLTLSFFDGPLAITLEARAVMRCNG